jgi:methyl-accepting chemotaxis protein
MHAISNRWRRLGLRLKLQILIQGFLLIVLGAVQVWISTQFERQILDSAEVRARAVGDGAVNGLNTLMVTKVGQDDVISDKAARALFIRKMGAADKIREVRIVRGPAVDAEFPAGLPEEQPVDEIDRRVLASGKAEVAMVRDRDGAAALRAVMPFVASRSFRGTDCLKCHGVDEGSVLGVASVAIDVKDDLASIRRINAWIWVGQVLLQLACALVLFFVARGVLRRLGGEPEAAAEVARIVAHGDLTVQLEVDHKDTSSLMARLKEMQGGLTRVVSDVRLNAERVAAASARIADGNLDLSSRTEEQAAALEETAASMEQLSATVRQNADNARQANELAHGASAVAVKGGEVVARVVDTMKGINDNSKKIADIIGVIDGIAFQTNILALNAAVEAARAGEQGRGFAVVAAEVRTLAQRSAEASRQIAGLITGSVERVAQGSALADRAGATMQEIVASIRRVTDIVAEISTASAEQSAGVSQVGEAITQMDQVTQQNASLVEHSAAAARNLRDQAEQLVQAVAVFKLAGAGTA